MTQMTRRAALQGGTALAAFLPMATACAPSRTLEAGAGDSAFVDGVRMAEMMAAGEMTPLEAVEAAIARAEAVEPRINAIAHKSYETAKAEAVLRPEGSLAGVPTFTKDLMDRIGEPTLFGSRAFEGYIASEDAPLAAAWRRAGTISLGKSTTPEMGLISTTEPLVTGPTRNPWNLDHTAGGSSGGAAALVAARVVPLAHASDGGGSIRIPASCCGLFGLKPSRARLHPRSPDDARGIDISVGHAVSLTVRDSEAIFRATQRRDGQYPNLGIIGGPSERRLRIAFAPDAPAGTPVDPEVTDALERTARLCRRLGHEVIDYRVPFDGNRFLDQFLLLWASGAAAFAQSASDMSGQPIGPDIVEPWTLGLAAMYESRQGEMAGVVEYLTQFERDYNEMFDSFDVLLSPTLGRPADPIGFQDVTTEFETLMERVVSFAAFTAPMNVAGAASMSVPLGWSEAGLPIGSMFSAKQGDDGMLFALAYELEQARPWIERLPPVIA